MAKGEKRPILERLRRALRHLLRKATPESFDPYAERLVPVRRGPKPRSGAAAVAGPEEDI
jgi:hypothetical protein